MDKVFSGNLNNQDNSKTRGWFIGHFIKEPYQLRSDKFEAKWGMHSKGEGSVIGEYNETAKTLGLLVQGKVKFNFPPSGKEIILKNVGDYVFYDARVPHKCEFLEDSIVLTLRWPSLQDDQVPYRDKFKEIGI